MNGARSTFMRTGYWFTALGAAVLLAASPGTALAQQAALKIDSLKLATTTVNEGAEATATMKFTATAGATDVDADEDVVVSFAYISIDLTTSPKATNAIAGSFSDITDKLIGAQKTITISALTAEAKKSYEVTYTFGLNHDTNAEDGQFKLTGSVADWTGGVDVTESPDTVYTIDDDEPQSYTLSIPVGDKGSIVEGDDAATAVTLTIDPPRTSDATVPMFSVVMDPNDPSLYTYAPGNVTAEDIGMSRTADAGTVAALVDKNRVDEIVTFKLYSGTVGASMLVHELPITVTDVHVLPAGSAVTAVAMDKDGEDVEGVVEGGDPVYLTITVDRGKGATAKTLEKLTVTVEPANPGMGSDYRLSGSPVTLDAVTTADGDQSTTAEIMLTAVTDEDVGDEELMLNLVLTGNMANGPGSSTGMFSIPITDDTTKKIAPKATEADYDRIKDAIAAGGGDEGLNPGDTVTLMTSDLFDLMEGYTASYGVSVEGDSASASASGEAVTINALMAGEAKITVTGTARMASSSLMPSQTVSNVAELTFPVMVVDTELVVTLSAEPMEIAAGGTTMITATANRAVTAGDGAVEIALAVVGDGTLDAESITIAMGDMSGSATLTANESVTVVATGSGVTGLMQVMVTVTDGPAPEPVPALPLIAQWLLGLGLMGGGARQLFRRRRQG